jgi:subtilase family serine protease
MISLPQSLSSARMAKASRPSRRSPRAVPALEALESRELPSVTAWEARPSADVTPLAGTASLTVYTPAQIRHAYGFDKLPFDGAGQTIAIVAAYDDPKVSSDLRYFDRTFGLADPPSFVKATPQGIPAANAAWASEIALDVEWAHAIAPRANILLVEAASSGGASMLAAIDYARSYPGVSVVSMSWGTPEFFNEALFDSHFTTPANHVGGGGRYGGITFVASSGDRGAWYGPEWPAVSPRVLAVGATSLRLTAGSSYSSETGWSGSGGGYSRYVAEPTYQSAVEHTGRRSTPDVAYDGDPYTGVYGFNSYSLPAGYSGWYSYGGTSAGAPQWAGLVALADQGRAWYGLGSLANAQATVYGLATTDFHAVSGGYNGYSVTSGYNPVTGRGSPYADRVAWDLIWAGSSTLTIGGPSGAGTAAPQTSARVRDVGLANNSDAGPFSYVADSGALPAWHAKAQTADTVFTPAADTTHSLKRPAITGADDLVWDVAQGRALDRQRGRPAAVEASVLDLSLFGEG